jgi:hypothetical protein
LWATLIGFAAGKSLKISTPGRVSFNCQCVLDIVCRIRSN